MSARPALRLAHSPRAVRSPFIWPHVEVSLPAGETGSSPVASNPSAMMNRMSASLEDCVEDPDFINGASRQIDGANSRRGDLQESPGILIVSCVAGGPRNTVNIQFQGLVTIIVRYRAIGMPQVSVPTIARASRLSVRTRLL